MNRITILARINKEVYEGLYSYQDVEQDLDDSIDRINEALNTKFPYFSTVFTTDDAEYNYVPDPSLPDVSVPIFPDKYIRSVCINYVISRLMKREDEFGALYQAAVIDYQTGIDNMFRDYYHQVPEVFQDTDGGFLVIEGETPDAVEATFPWGVDD